MANNPSFSFYVNDFEGGTRHMTDAELGCYLRLLIAQFNRGGILPDDEKFLRRFSTSFDESWPFVKEKFKKINGGLQNERLEIETFKRKKFIEKQSGNGQKGGRPIKPTENPNNNPEETQTKSQKKPLGYGYGDGKGYGDGLGKQDGGSGEENLIVPQMCKLWYDNFPTYTADRDSDFSAMGTILWFIAKQAHLRQVQDTDVQVKILNTLQLIADQVNRETFWVNKPIKSIANNLQEFYNKIKNPVNGKQQSGTNGQSTSKEQFRTDVQAELSERFKKRRQSSG